MPTVERRRALVPAKDTISSLAARTYAEAATQDASMRLAVDQSPRMRLAMTFFWISFEPP